MSRRLAHPTTCILSLLALLCSACGAKPVAGFDDYLKQFPTVSNDLSWEQIFRADYHYPHDSFWVQDSAFVRPMLEPDGEDITEFRIITVR